MVLKDFLRQLDAEYTGNDPDKDLNMEVVVTEADGDEYEIRGVKFDYNENKVLIEN